MARVKIVTDSAQDFEPEVLEQMGITVVPLNVHFGDELYKDGYEIRGKFFYEKLVTSQHICLLYTSHLTYGRRRWLNLA